MPSCYQGGSAKYTGTITQAGLKNRNVHPVVENMLSHRCQTFLVNSVYISDTTAHNDHIGIEEIDDHGNGFAKKIVQPINGLCGCCIIPLAVVGHNLFQC